MSSPPFLAAAAAPVLASLALACGASACHTTAKVIAMPGVDVVASYSRADYVVIGDAEGKACVEETCVLGLFCSTKSDDGGSAREEGRLSRDVQTSAPATALPFGAASGTEGNTSAAEEAAMYRAMESVPDADALLAPRKSMEVTTTRNFLLPSTRACVRVFGKGMRLKTDAELAAAAPAPTTTPTTPAPPTPLTPEPAAAPGGAP